MRIWEIIKCGITRKIELFQSFPNNFGRNILDEYFHLYIIVFIYNSRNIMKTTTFRLVIETLFYIYFGTV